jgi:hypothetical protein
MTRYMARTQTKPVEFPHRVEIIVPKGGFGKRLHAMHGARPARQKQPRLCDVVFWRCSDGGQFSSVICPVVNDKHSLHNLAVQFFSKMSSLDWKEIEINWRGKRAKGRYIVSGDLVTVAAWNGTKAARRGILPAERLAQMLLRELAAETEKK